MEFSTIVDAATLEQHLDDARWVVFDCRFSLKNTAEGRQKYDAGHIPGARYADLDRHLSSPKRPDSGRHPLPAAEAFVGWLRRCGVNRDSQVVVYDDVGGVIAGRLWWLLRMFGHHRAAVLDGGYKAWTRGGNPVSSEQPVPSRGDFDGTPWDDWWVSSRDVEKAVSAGKGGAPLIDARSGQRFRGEKEPIDPVAGHVPGAVNRPCDDNLDEQGMFRPAGQLREAFAALIGDSEGGDVIHMCGSGVSACHNILAMVLAGWPVGRLYVGSWSEWITDPGREIETSS